MRQVDEVEVFGTFGGDLPARIGAVRRKTKRSGQPGGQYSEEDESKLSPKAGLASWNAEAGGAARKRSRIENVRRAEPGRLRTC
jgi:hypothetical protein